MEMTSCELSVDREALLSRQNHKGGRETATAG